jgi:predicted ATP-dependent endonuclease of OLD family
MRGKSQEVLRNKILQHGNRSRFTEQVSKVLSRDLEFIFENENRSIQDEYVDLRVDQNGRQLDLHLQGSGLIQVAEIFATVDYLASKLNILLIDEPDSHIHLALQKRLMESLKALEDNQTFIISHNDTFVREVDNGELFYLNQDAKGQKQLRALEDFDLIKRDFGSPILALENLNTCSHVVFVEGSDDKSVFEEILRKYMDGNIIAKDTKIAKCHFFHIRGKDDLIAKIDHNKRTLSQLFRDKKYIVITDKDFTTLANSDALNRDLKMKLGKSAEAFCHDAYCIESTLLTDIEALSKYINFTSGKSFISISAKIIVYLSGLLDALKNVTSNEFKELEAKFESQKRNRPELAGTNFNQVIQDSVSDIESLRYIMNKEQIMKLIRSLEKDLQVEIVEGTVEDKHVAEVFFRSYLVSIPEHRILFDEHKKLLNRIYGLTLD